jgi:hypothetical protein
MIAAIVFHEAERGIGCIYGGARDLLDISSHGNQFNNLTPFA